MRKTVERRDDPRKRIHEPKVTRVGDQKACAWSGFSGQTDHGGRCVEASHTISQPCEFSGPLPASAANVQKKRPERYTAQRKMLVSGQSLAAEIHGHRPAIEKCERLIWWCGFTVLSVIASHGNRHRLTDEIVRARVGRDTRQFQVEFTSGCDRHHVVWCGAHATFRVVENGLRASIAYLAQGL